MLIHNPIPTIQFMNTSLSIQSYGNQIKKIFKEFLVWLKSSILNAWTIGIIYAFLLILGYATSSQFNNLSSLKSVFCYTFFTWCVVYLLYSLDKKFVPECGTAAYRSKKIYKTLDTMWCRILVYCFLPTIGFYVMFVFSTNHFAMDKKVGMIIDGKPVTEEGLLWINPYRQRIQLVNFDQSITEFSPVQVTGTTKDNKPIHAGVSVQLRMNEDPKLWLSNEEMKPLIYQAIQKRFADTIAGLNSSEVSSDLQLEFDVYDQGENDEKSGNIENRQSDLRRDLPPNVKLNGKIKVHNIHVYKVE